MMKEPFISPLTEPEKERTQKEGKAEQKRREISDKVDFQRRFISQCTKYEKITIESKNIKQSEIKLYRFVFQPNLAEALTNLLDFFPHEISCTYNTLNILLKEPHAAKEEVYTIYLPKNKTAEARYRVCALFKDYLDEEIGFDQIDYKEALIDHKINIYNEKGFTSPARIKSLALQKFGCTNETSSDLVFKTQDDNRTVRFVFKEQEPDRCELYKDQIPLKELFNTKRVDEITCSILDETRKEAVRERNALVKHDTKKDETKKDETKKEAVKESKELIKERVKAVKEVDVESLSKDLAILIEKQKNGANHQQQLSELLDRVVGNPVALDFVLSHLAGLDQDIVSKSLLEYIKKKIDERKVQIPEKSNSVITTLITRYFELFTLEQSSTQASKSYCKYHYSRCEELFNYAEKANVFHIPKNSSDTDKPDALWLQLSLFFNGCKQLNRKNDRSWEAKAYYDLIKWMLSPLFGTKQVDFHRLFPAIEMLAKARMDIELAKSIDNKYGFKSLYEIIIKACEQFPTQTIAALGGSVTALSRSFQTSSSTEILVSKNLKNWQSTIVSMHITAYKMDDAQQILEMHLSAVLRIMSKIDYKDFPFYLPILMNIFNSENIDSETFPPLKWTPYLRELFLLFKSPESQVYYLDFHLLMIRQYLIHKEADPTLVVETIQSLILACEKSPMVSSKIASPACRKLASEAGSFMAYLSGSLLYCESEKVDWIKIKHEMNSSISRILEQTIVKNDISLQSHYKQLTKEIAFLIKVEQFAMVSQNFINCENLPQEIKQKKLHEELELMLKFLFAEDTFEIMLQMKDINMSKRVFSALLDDINFLDPEEKERLLIRWVTHIGGFAKHPHIFSKETLQGHYQDLLRLAIDKNYTIKSKLVAFIHEAYKDPKKTNTLPTK